MNLTQNNDRPTLHVISQAHLDPVWLWTWQDGFAEGLTTLQSAVNRLHEFPEMRYTCSSAYIYRWIAKTDPRLFNEIREFINQGRWELVGGWVVQADTLHPNELSLQRQGMLAQEWFRKHLGVTAKIGYCVDSFGHSIGIPSILNDAGMRYYVFQRPQPHERPDLPNLFWWEAPDGARVLTWRLAHGYGQAPDCGADELESALRRTWHELLVPEMSLGTWFVGVGNHGGGPTKTQLERVCKLKQTDDPELPRIQFSSLGDFFTEIEQHPKFPDIPVVHGEIVHHARGCYAANTRLKRLHRQAERELCNSERLHKICTEGGSQDLKNKMPPDILHEAWWSLCFNQFHDILPGSSIPKAYEEARDNLGAVRHTARKLSVSMVHSMARRTDTRTAPEGVLFLVNPLPWERTALVQIDTLVSPHNDSSITHLTSPEGVKLPLQWTAAEAGFGPHLKEWKKLVAAVPLPASGSCWLKMAHGDAPSASPYSAIEPSLLTIAETARLLAIEDCADTWGHYTDRWNNVLGQAEIKQEKLLDDGPLFRRRRRWLEWGASKVILDIVEWRALGVIELIVYINWQDRFQTLKLELTPGQKQESLRARTPGGAVERPLDGNEWFFADWLLCSGDHRLFVISDGASAYDATAERLRLTLLRCVPHAQHQPVPHPEDSPAQFLDEGYQQARFILMNPGVDTPSEILDQLAAGILIPAEHMLDSAHPGSDCRD